MKRKKCKREGCTNPVWSGGLCQNHIGRKPLKKKSNISTFKSGLTKNKPQSNKKSEHQKRVHFFMKIWRKRPHKSEVSGTYLGSEALSTFFHHILPRIKFPIAEYDPENIILLTPDEHADVESDMFRFEEVNKRRKQLLKKYNLI